jgi:hypothetical protein
MKRQYSLRALAFIVALTAIGLALYGQLTSKQVAKPVVHVIRSSAEVGVVLIDAEFDSRTAIGYKDYPPFGSVDVLNENGQLSFSKAYFTANGASRGSTAPTITLAQQNEYEKVFRFVTRAIDLDEIPKRKLVRIPIPSSDPDMAMLRKRLERCRRPDTVP